MGVFSCVYFLSPSCQCIIDLYGPVGEVLTEDTDTREPAIRQTQPAHYPRAHDNSCLVPPQGQGCSCSHYVMKQRGRWQRREGVYWDVSQCIIPHRAYRLPVTRSGWGFLLTVYSILAWSPPGTALQWPRGLQYKTCSCGVLSFKLKILLLIEIKNLKNKVFLSGSLKRAWKEISRVSYFYTVMNHWEKLWSDYWKVDESQNNDWMLASNKSESEYCSPPSNLHQLYRNRWSCPSKAGHRGLWQRCTPTPTPTNFRQ